MTNDKKISKPYKLIEGNSYFFTILRVVQMPPDGEEYYVMESEFGSKHLLVKHFYQHYNLKKGRKILCRIDKINCSGRVFLEPEHPGCKPGDILEFSVTRDQVFVNSFGDEEILLILNDPWNGMAYLNVQERPELKNNEVIKCKVERIKKGQLLISHPDFDQAGQIQEEGSIIEFSVIGIKTMAENYEYLILENGSSQHYLRFKYYSDYGFSKYGKVKCRVLSEPCLYGHYLEPVHPYYEPGKEYLFDFLKTEDITTADGKIVKHVVIKDLIGHEYTIPFDVQIPDQLLQVRALVKEIRMSKCVPEFKAFE
jgi:hypothetical protein